MKSTTDQSVHSMFPKRANKYQFQKKKKKKNTPDGEKSWKKNFSYTVSFSQICALCGPSNAPTHAQTCVHTRRSESGSRRVDDMHRPRTAHDHDRFPTTLAYSCNPERTCTEHVRRRDSVCPRKRAEEPTRVCRRARAHYDDDDDDDTLWEIHGTARVACKLRILGILSANPSPSPGFRTLRLLRKLRRAICATMSGLLLWMCVRYIVARGRATL